MFCRSSQLIAAYERMQYTRAIVVVDPVVESLVW